ncbi:bifunctional phosphoribosylaminoimidazolecarboxamide formyltransferase/IMP cyclohydrolase [Bartonella sp. DGB2]|uniref:bifunctional phosphoribosylaminoimidazolecarboxamide formyltransferase/IMP cyclohydrolase n=1 Tax=Bartonella sp. DGB2 TaxID=3388426 RepID=UPI0039900374
MTLTSKHIKAPDFKKINRALLSVSDKTGLVDLAHALADQGVELISTGGTKKLLIQAGLAVKDVSEITNFPEILDGRVKTLHPAVHAGILAVGNDCEHQATLKAHAITPIDLVVVNLYPFEKTAGQGSDVDTIIENIDIGGPAMIRAAAKNHAYSAIVTDPADYAALIATLNANNGCLSFAFRQNLAARAFARTSAYDSAISQWFSQQLNLDMGRWQSFFGELHTSLRYGENPHQHAAFYKNSDLRPGAATAQIIQGKQLSYNNINDTDAAFELVSEFSQETAAVAIVKHANPCGVALASSLKEAYVKALACDPVSAFGGIIALNQTLDASTATEIVKIFTEVIIAPAADEDAKAIIGSKKNLRLLITGGLADPRASGLMAKTVAGGLLIQSRDNGMIEDCDLKIVTKRAPTENELQDLKFAFKVAKHVKSNAIIYAKDHATFGIGAGQMSRLDSARIAARKGQEAGLIPPAQTGLVVASDAFFPFADGLLAAVEAGATAVIQPGGSLRDQEVIDAANTHDIAMVFTGMRHFRH